MVWDKPINRLYLLATSLLLHGCFSYSFTGVSIPDGVQTIFIPFFPDQSPSGLSSLPDLLNEALVNQFVNQSRLNFVSDADAADAVLQGQIVGYTNRPSVVGPSGVAELNEISITVKASFKYANETQPEWDKSFSSSAPYDPNQDPITAEADAVSEILTVLARNMFNDALSSW